MTQSSGDPNSSFWDTAVGVAVPPTLPARASPARRIKLSTWGSWASIVSLTLTLLAAIWRFREEIMAHPAVLLIVALLLAIAFLLWRWGRRWGRTAGLGAKLATAILDAERRQKAYTASLQAPYSLGALTLETAREALKGPFRAGSEDEDLLKERFAQPLGYEQLYAHRVTVIVGHKGCGKSVILKHEELIRKDDPECLVVAQPFEGFPIDEIKSLHTDKIADLAHPEQFWRLFWRVQLLAHLIRAIKKQHQGRDQDTEPDPAGLLPDRLDDQIRDHCHQLAHADDPLSKLRNISTLGRYEQDIRHHLGIHPTQIFLFQDNINHEWFLSEDGKDNGILIQALISALAEIAPGPGLSFRAVVAIHDGEGVERVDESYEGLKYPEQVIHLAPQPDDLARILAKRLTCGLEYIPPDLPFRHLWWHLAEPILPDGKDSWQAATDKAGSNATKLLTYVSRCVLRTGIQPIPTQLLDTTDVI